MNSMTMGLVAMTAACACSGTQEYSAAPHSDSESTAGARATAWPDGETPAPETPHKAAPPGNVACPIVPMRMVVTLELPPDPHMSQQMRDAMRQPQVMISLDAKGDVHVPLAAAQGRDPLGHLDPRGCIVAAGSVVTERLPTTIWTLRESLRVDGSRVHLGQARWADFAADGTVNESGDAPGAAATRFDGYEPRGLCAAQLMLTTVRAIFAGVSMAVSDGAAKKLSTPAQSVCPELPHD